MKILVFTLITFFHFSLLSSEEKSDTILITAKPIKSEFVHNPSYVEEDGTARELPSAFNVTVTDIEVQLGSLTTDTNQLTFGIAARDDYQLMNSDEIFILFKVVSDDLVVLDWGYIQKLICVKKSLINEQMQKKYFKISAKHSQDLLCRYEIYRP
jgi:hypothetical protein